nr:hypothetical protein [Candidatus Njordarchaeota archaeon]
MRTSGYFLLTIVLGMCFLHLGYATLSDPINDRDSTELSYTADSSYKPTIMLGVQAEPNLQSTDYDVVRRFSLKIPLFGYKVTADSEEPLDWDGDGLLTLRQASKNLVDVSLTLESGTY